MNRKWLDLSLNKCKLFFFLVRFILFCLIWLVTMGKHHFWLLPNLTEDVGFFDSFKPLYHHEMYDKESTDKKSSKDTISAKETAESKTEKSKDDSNKSKESGEDEDKGGSEKEETGSEENGDNGYELIQDDEIEESKKER